MVNAVVLVQRKQTAPWKTDGTWKGHRQPWVGTWGRPQRARWAKPDKGPGHLGHREARTGVGGEEEGKEVLPLCWGSSDVNNRESTMESAQEGAGHELSLDCSSSPASAPSSVVTRATLLGPQAERCLLASTLEAGGCQASRSQGLMPSPPSGRHIAFPQLRAPESEPILGRRRGGSPLKLRLPT